MPVESAAIQVQWTSPNKAIVGCNNTSLLNVSSRYEFGQKIRKVAVIGAGPAGVKIQHND